MKSKEDIRFDCVRPRFNKMTMCLRSVLWT